MILIPSAFIEVFFEPITDKLVLAYNNTIFVLKWAGFALLYLAGIVVIFFGACAVFVLGQEIYKWVGL